MAEDSTTSKTAKPKKSIDDQINDTIKRLEGQYEKKFRESSKDDDEKAIARIVSTAKKQKKDGKGAKSEDKVNSELGVFMGKKEPYKEDYHTIIQTLFRASLDAQSKPKETKKESSS